MALRERARCRGSVARFRSRVLALVVGGLVCTPAAWLPVRAAEPQRPLQHHATVLNGGVVGSAFALADGVAVTNAHVVRGLRPGAPVRIVAPDGGRRSEARLVATSARMDLAVLAVPAGLVAPVAASDAPRAAGLPVLAAGVDASGARRDLPRLALPGTLLIPSRHIPAFGAGLVARIPGVRPGFSGGPVFDAQGRLVGMLTAIRPATPLPAPRPVAAAGSPPREAGPRPADEAFVLGAAELRAEVRRLLGAAELRAEVRRLRAARRP